MFSLSIVRKFVCNTTSAEREPRRRRYSGYKLHGAVEYGLGISGRAPRPGPPRHLLRENRGLECVSMPKGLMTGLSDGPSSSRRAYLSCVRVQGHNRTQGGVIFTGSISNIPGIQNFGLQWVLRQISLWDSSRHIHIDDGHIARRVRWCCLRSPRGWNE